MAGLYSLIAGDIIPRISAVMRMQNIEALIEHLDARAMRRSLEVSVGELVRRIRDHAHPALSGPGRRRMLWSLRAYRRRSVSSCGEALDRFDRASDVARSAVGNPDGYNIDEVIGEYTDALEAVCLAYDETWERLIEELEGISTGEPGIRVAIDGETFMTLIGIPLPCGLCKGTKSLGGAVCPLCGGADPGAG